MASLIDGLIKWFHWYVEELAIDIGPRAWPKLIGQRVAHGVFVLSLSSFRP